MLATGHRRDARAWRGSSQADPDNAAPTSYVACLAASLLLMLSTLLFNGALGRAYGSVDGFAPDWSTAAGAVTLVALTAVSRRRPGALVPVVCTAVAVALLLAGHLAAGAGVRLGSAALIVAGVCAQAAAQAWVTLLWLLACSRLDTRGACACIAGGCALAMPVAWALSLVATATAAQVADVACYLGAIALSFPMARSPLGRAASMGTAPVDREISQPRAFVPLGHRLFAYFLAFGVAYGFALRTGGGQGSMTSNALAACAMLAVALYCVALGRPPRADALFRLSFLLVLCGFLLVLVGSALASKLLVTGFLCFELLVWMAVCSVARRSAADAVPAIAWGTAASYAGIFLGAQLGMVETWLATRDATAGALLVAAVLASIVTYVVFTLGGFSIDATLDAVERDAPVPEPIPAERLVDAFDARCDEISADAGLTPREDQVMRLLARGNNAQHVTEELCVSRNTVKFHARNVYAKLGVHSQQELIDLVARTR